LNFKKIFLALKTGNKKIGQNVGRFTPLLEWAIMQASGGEGPGVRLGSLFSGCA